MTLKKPMRLFPKNKKKQNIFIVVATLLILSALLRDFVFINLNFKLHYLAFPDYGDNAHSFFNFLNNLSYTTVYILKWVASGFFVLYSFISTAYLMYLRFNSKESIKWTKVIYGIILGLSILAFGIGWLINTVSPGWIYKGYEISRFFLKIIQSPLPFLVLLLTFLIFLVPQKNS